MSPRPWNRLARAVPRWQWRRYFDSEAFGEFVLVLAKRVRFMLRPSCGVEPEDIVNECVVTVLTCAKWPTCVSPEAYLTIVCRRLVARWKPLAQLDDGERERILRVPRDALAELLSNEASLSLYHGLRAVQECLLEDLTDEDWALIDPRRRDGGGHQGARRRLQRHRLIESLSPVFERAGLPVAAPGDRDARTFRRLLFTLRDVEFEDAEPRAVLHDIAEGIRNTPPNPDSRRGA